MSWPTMEEIARIVIEHAIRRQEAATFFLRVIRSRFQDVPPDLEQIIQSTQDLDRLRSWLDKALQARTLNSLGLDLVEWNPNLTPPKNSS